MSDFLVKPFSESNKKWDKHPIFGNTLLTDPETIKQVPLFELQNMNLHFWGQFLSHNPDWLFNILTYNASLNIDIERLAKTCKKHSFNLESFPFDKIDLSKIHSNEQQNMFTFLGEMDVNNLSEDLIVKHFIRIDDYVKRITMYIRGLLNNEKIQLDLDWRGYNTRSVRVPSFTVDDSIFVFKEKENEKHDYLYFRLNNRYVSVCPIVNPSIKIKNKRTLKMNYTTNYLRKIPLSVINNTMKVGYHDFMTITDSAKHCMAYFDALRSL